MRQYGAFGIAGRRQLNAVIESGQNSRRNDVLVRSDFNSPARISDLG